MAGTNRRLAAYKDTTMSNDPFTDEILSAIIDGEADPEIVADVAADPAASARLAQLQSVVSMVGAPVADAEPDRRRASIAAAMAAASPAPEVTSLAVARQQRESTRRGMPARQWLGLAAAAVALVIVIPLIANLRSDGDETATDASEDHSLAVTDEAASDAGSDGAGGLESDAGDLAPEAPAVAADEAMDEQASDDSMDDSANDSADAADEEAPSATTTAPAESIDRFLTDAIVLSNVAILDEMITLGSITPELTLDQVLELGVAPDCAIPLAFSNDRQFAVAYFDNGETERRLILISFNEDETTTALDAEDCSRLR